MSSAVKIKITGVNSIDNVMRGLPMQITKRVLIAASKEAAKPIIKEMKSRYSGHNKTGKGLKSISTTTMPDNGKFKGNVFAGVRSKGNVGKKQKYDGWYLKFIEGGTKEREAGEGRLKFTTSSGVVVYAQRAKAIPAKPFAEPSISSNVVAAQENYRESLAIVLHRYMKRTIKNNSK